MLWLLIPLASPAALADDRPLDLSAAPPTVAETLSQGDKLCLVALPDGVTATLQPSDGEGSAQDLAVGDCRSWEELDDSTTWTVMNDARQVLATITLDMSPKGGSLNGNGNGNGSGNGDDDGSPPPLSSMVRKDVAAAVAASGQDSGYEQAKAGWGRRAYTIILGPDGQPLAPIPQEVAEGDTVSVWMVASDEVRPAFEVKSCPERPAFRVNGDWEEVRGTTDSGDEEITWEVMPLGTLSCGAGEVQLSVSSQSSWADTPADFTTSVTWTVAETYRATAALSVGYDSAPVNELYLEKGAEPETGATQEYTLRRSQDQQGMQADAVFIFHPAGYTPGRITWAGALLNPTLGLPLDSLSGLDSVFIGDSIMVPGLPGIWVTAGAHLQARTRPKDGSGYEIGATTTESNIASIPTQTSWRSPGDGAGFFAGISIDVATFSRLKGKAEAGTDEKGENKDQSEDQGKAEPGSDETGTGETGTDDGES